MIRNGQFGYDAPPVNSNPNIDAGIFEEFLTKHYEPTKIRLKHLISEVHLNLKLIWYEMGFSLWH
jgi:hypothetical protein